MFASIAAAGCGHQVVVYEKNEKLGKKLYITGKGRCNITNACDMEGLFDAVRTNAKFLYSSFYGYTNQQVIDFFERIGVPTKIERGDRVFPVSDHSSDVIRGLEREMDRLGVKVHLRTAVKKVVAKDGHFEKIILGDQRQIHADACIVATGGLSYQSTGSTGDGFRFAESLGHTVTDCMPAFKNAVHKLFPSKLIPVMIELSGIDPEKKVNVITKEERLGFVRLIKGLTCTLTDLRDYNEAIITKGGVKIKEVDPGTMESKLVKGLHFAGEVLDLDAVTGGFNLQIAWSTAYAAGTGIQI